jgi:tRNA dimethylallyltransferase
VTVAPAVYLCGPTAVGKSAVALELAALLHGEIISVDSMQVYRGMDIGAAKPSAPERARIPHHLLDVVDLRETFDAARFVELARAADRAIRARGKLPIYCGGTGFYFNALLQGLGESPPSDPAVRADLQATPLDHLLAELKSADAQTFETIDRANPRRVMRALEVIRLTGRPFSESRAPWNEISETIIGLEMPRERLNSRIDARVDAMLRNGLVAETEQLLANGLRENPTASQALGYKQIVEHLDGKAPLPQTIELVKLRTRQFAKRQMTWFKRQLPVRWLIAEESATPDQIARQLIDEHKLV